MTSPRRSRFYAVAFVLSALVAARPASAQSGSITGVVTDSVGGRPVAGVEVTVRLPDGTGAATVLTDAAGVYLTSALDPGSYTVRFDSPGWDSAERAVRVEPGVATRLSVRLRPSFFRIPGVSTVARSYEPLLEAPASVSALDREELARRPQLTVLEQIRSLPGMDVIQTGLTEGQMIPRGFNRLFNARILLLTDGRIAQTPGMRANFPSMIPATSLDMDRIELVRGPASALYGPDAADGVLQIFTKSPFDEPGMSFALTTGVREQGRVPGYPTENWGFLEGYPASADGLVQLEGRAAAAFSDHWAAKVSGRWLRGTEWRHLDSVEASNRAGAEACLADFSSTNPFCSRFGLEPTADEEDRRALEQRLSRIGRRNFTVHHGNIDGRVDWVPNERTELTVSSGIGWIGSGIGLLGGGAAQVEGARISYGRIRLRVGELSAQADVSRETLEEGHTLRQGFPIAGSPTLWTAQLQHRRALGEVERLSYGVDGQFNIADPGIRTAYRDRDDISIVGAFVQSETDLGRRWRVVAAGRVDVHSVLPEPVFSPRIATVFTPAAGHSVRVTVNRAFTTPLRPFLFQDRQVGRVTLEGLGYPLWSQASAGDGFAFERIDGRPAMKSPLASLIPGSDPTAFLPSTTEQLYDLARAHLRALGDPRADVMDAVGPPPTEADVAVRLRMLDPSIGERELPGGLASIRDIPPLREQSTTTFEVGYRGLLWDRALLSVDAYYTEKGSYLGPFQPVAPNVFLDGESLVDFFVSRGVDEETARSVAMGTDDAPGVSELPLGVIIPRGVSEQGPVLLRTPLNYGDLRVHGADVALEVRLDRAWSTAWAVSFVSDDLFEADGLEVALNATTLQWSGSLTYRGTNGLDGSARYRFTEGFPVRMLEFNGDVEDAGVLDVGLGYRLPWSESLRVQVDVQNVFDVGYRTFVGAPELGRLTMVRAVWGL